MKIHFCYVGMQLAVNRIFIQNLFSLTCIVIVADRVSCVLHLGVATSLVLTLNPVALQGRYFKVDSAKFDDISHPQLRLLQLRAKMF